MVVIIRFMNGQDIEVPLENVTVNDIRVVAANKLNVFAPDITVLLDGVPLMQDDICIAPENDTTLTRLHVVATDKQKNDEFWGNAMRAHMKGWKDVAGGEKALAKLSQTAREACFLEEASKGYTIGGSTIIIDTLLKAGTNVDCTDRFGRSGLMYASFTGCEALAQRLIEAGANVNHIGPQGMPCLMYAALGGHTEVARLLLEAKARVNDVDENQDSSLMSAARYGRKYIVSLLLNAGASVLTVNRFGRSIFEETSRRGYTEIHNMLQKAREIEEEVS